jgi:hypothetical protein
MIINEQEILTPRRLRRDGYQALPQPPSDFSSSTYSRKVAGGKTWYKRKDGQPIEVEEGPELTQYEGTYKVGQIKGSIFKDGQTLKGSIGVINSPLVYQQGETFSVSTANFGSGTITFVKNGSGIVTGFNFKVGSYKGVGEKVSDSDSPSQNPPSPSTSNPKPTVTPPPPPPTPVKTIDYKVKYPSTQNPTKPFNWKPCDENVYNWEYGCKNNKIAMMNRILFGDKNDYGGIYGKELLDKLRNLVYLNPSDTKITEDIYNKVLKLGEEQGRVKIQETIVKQTVKNILKERLIKK